MMDSTAFVDPTEANDYDTFKTNFLETFGEYARRNIVKGVNGVCERLGTAVFSKNELDAQIIAGKTARDVMRLLEDNACLDDDGKLSNADLRVFIEFFSYMLVLQDKKRKTALSLEFKLTDRIHDFCNKLKTKLEETGNKALGAVANLASTQPANPSSSAETTKFAAATESSTLICHYCQKPGHTANRCYAKSRDKRKERKTTTSTKVTSSTNTNTQNRTTSANTGAIPKTSRSVSNPSTSATSAPKYCYLHNSRTHSTEECYKINKMRQDMLATRNPTNSGEDTRPFTNKPG